MLQANFIHTVLQQWYAYVHKNTYVSHDPLQLYEKNLFAVYPNPCHIS